jgi:sulfate permease, SulP family
VLLVGAILVAARFLRLGPLVENINVAVLDGVKVGVGLTVAASQLPKLLGVEPEPGGTGFFSTVGAVVDRLGDTNAATALLGGGTIVLLLGLRRMAPRAPGPLVAVALGIVLVEVANLPDHGVALIPEVPSGLPLPSMPSFDVISGLLPGAIAIALMVYLETVAVARGVRQPNEPPLDNDGELVAVGAASLAGAFFSTLPAAGGFSQTAVNEAAGARTQVSEVATVVLAVATALFLGPVLSDLPEATLGALVFVAVIGLIQPSSLVRLGRIDRIELVLALGTAAIGLTAGLLAAVGAGVVATLVLVLHELNHPTLIELRRPPGGGPLRPAQVGDEAVPGLLVLRIGAPLYTANARAMERGVLERIAAEDPRPRVLLLDAVVVGDLSVTVLDVLEELDQQLGREDVTLWLSALPERALAVARRVEWWDSWQRAGRVLPSADDAVAAFERR